MRKRNETDALKETIQLLKRRQAGELAALKDQFHEVYETLKPINLVKNMFREVASSPGIGSNIVNNVIGLTTGYLSKKILVGTSHNPINKIFGALLQFVVSKVASTHADSIKSAGENILQRILKYKDGSKHAFHNNGNEPVEK